VLKVQGVSRWPLSPRLLTIIAVATLATVGTIIVQQGHSSASASVSIETAASRAACANAGYGLGTVTSVDGAYQSTSQAVQKWAATDFPSPPSTSVTAAASGTTPFAVCYISGNFNGSIPTASRQTTGYNDLIVTVNEDTGAIILNLAAPTGNWGFATPPAN
jgi:hypothetical protein